MDLYEETEELVKPDKYVGRHRKPKRMIFRKPRNIWEWVEQAVQVVFIIAAVSIVLLVLLGEIAR